MAEESTTSRTCLLSTTGDDTTQAESGQPWSVDKYVQLAVVVIGVVGTTGNALILYALVASKQHKKHVLIVNQNALDLFSSFFLVVSYSVKLCNIGYVGSLGYWICLIFDSEIFVWWGLAGSIFNLVTITIDRYLKVVHHAWSKRWLRPKVINLAIVFAWFAGIAANAHLFETSGINDGVCYTWVLFKSNVDRIATLLFTVLSFYVIIIAVFIFCYGRILIAIRRQEKVMAGHSAHGATTAQAHQSHVIQHNVIKTMILVSTFYAIAWLPVNVYNAFIIFDPNVTYLNNLWYVSMFMANLYTCANPFIYATKFDPVRRVLKDVIPWKKNTSVQPNVGVSASIKLQNVTKERY